MKIETEVKLLIDGEIITPKEINALFLKKIIVIESYVKDGTKCTRKYPLITDILIDEEQDQVISVRIGGRWQHED